MGKAAAVPPPRVRSLRVFAFDPSLGHRFGNHMTVAVPYEDLERGPRGFDVEVVDYDASNRCYYTPVDLDDRDVLLQAGLAPSEADPRFHQQMVYAVASRTIDNFSSALGRRFRWTRRRPGATRKKPRPLRIFPHALQEANAFYDPDRHALVFGYFTASGSDVGSNLPGQTVFTCLSHDIIAHETTHALVSDVRHWLKDLTGLDVLAFHEAFADIVALFQHFSFEDALLDHILRTGGAIFRPELRPVVPIRGSDVKAGARPATQAEEAQRNVLVGLAEQFGEAIGMRAALRSALGSSPDPAELPRRTEPHERGAILVAAIFDAFFSAYAARMADLLRIARGGAGTSGGDLSTDLARRLAAEAAKTAGHFANICIRALDYLPPVDVSFGDFLRALLTADCDLIPDDDLGYRDILIEAFRRRGIRPVDVASFSEEALVWQPGEGTGGRRLACHGLDFDVIWGTSADVLQKNAEILSRFGRQHARALQLQPGVPVQAWSFHPVHRVGPDGQLRFQIFVELVQTRQVPLDPRRKSSGSMTYRGGTTLVLDARDQSVSYAIFKRVASATRLVRQREFRQLWNATRPEHYAGGDAAPVADFAALHRGY
jgi:hypothetical protein